MRNEQLQCGYNLFGELVEERIKALTLALKGKEFFPLFLASETLGPDAFVNRLLLRLVKHLRILNKAMLDILGKQGEFLGILRSFSISVCLPIRMIEDFLFR